MSEEGPGVRAFLGASDEQPKTTTGAALAQLAFERLSLFTAIFGFALLLVKIMRVSHLNSRSAHALVATVGPMEIILGTFVTHFPTILFVIALLLTWWAIGSFAAARTFSTAHVAAAATVLFALLLLPWPFVVALLAIGVFRWFHRRSHADAPARRTGYYLVVGAVAVLLIADAEPWLPPERFAMKDGTEVLGYALAEAETSTGWMIILKDGDRSVVHVPEEEIAQRHPCHHESEHQELEDYGSLLQLVIGEETDLPEPPCSAEGAG
ncbi:MAG: hypothetical protein M3198_12995 [Actinomycetota bacterium]|nr:hypothetical protein [Actinomycetota bacterium]